MASADILDHFRRQGEICGRMGSPFTALVCDVLADLLPIQDGAIARSVLGFAGDPRAGALALRLCGGLNALHRNGRALDGIYPPAQVSRVVLSAALHDALIAHEAELLPWLDTAPQTNEVARSGVLLGGLLKIVEEGRGPLSLYEIGSSAGLNLMLDHYGYDLGQGRRWVPSDAPVQLECEWSGTPAHLETSLNITDRQGSDPNPLNAADPVARERMLAYIWPDQPKRVARATAALDLLAVERPRIDPQGAFDWLEHQQDRLRADPAHPVILHSVMWQYLERAEQDAVTRLLHAIGAERAMSWVRVEADSSDGGAAILLTSWPGGETRELGRADFHGRWARWHDVPISGEDTEGTQP